LNFDFRFLVRFFASPLRQSLEHFVSPAIGVRPFAAETRRASGQAATSVPSLVPPSSW
jgi:hypothetical protein